MSYRLQDIFLVSPPYLTENYNSFENPSWGEMTRQALADARAKQKQVYDTQCGYMRAIGSD